MDNEYTNPEFDALNSTGKRPWTKDESPLPLRRVRSESEPFPLAALGDHLRPVAERMIAVIKAPESLCAQSVLAATTFAAQEHADVKVDGRKCPVSEDFISIGQTGERKSALDRIANSAAYQHEKELKTAYDSDRSKYQYDADAYWLKHAEIKKKGAKQSREQLRREFEQLGTPPLAPIEPIKIAEEPTYEGLIKYYLVGQPSVGLFSDEGGRFLGGNGMNADNQQKTVVGLCELWDGKRTSRMRAGDGTALLYGRRLSIHVMVQPVIASQLFSNGLLSGQGFLSRCLSVWPSSTIGSRLYAEVDLSSDPVVEKYHQRLIALFREPAPMLPMTRNELDPRTLLLSDKAKRLFVAFHDDVELQLAPGKRFEEIKGLGAKAAEHAARLAGSLSVIEDFHCGEIRPLEMDCGITLVRFYLEEALRIKQESSGTPDIELAEELLAWFASHNKAIFYLAEVYQKGPNQIREAAIAKRIIGILEEHGYLVRLEPRIMDGSRRNDVWEVRNF